MFPINDKPGRSRLADPWRDLHKSYRFPPPPARSHPARGQSPPGAPWQTIDVGPWAKGVFAATFLFPLLFPPLFALLFPLGAVCSLLLGINHVYHSLDEEPVWAVPAVERPGLRESPYEVWVREGQETQRLVEGALFGLPRGMRRAFWPLTQQAEDLVQSLQRLAMRARQIDAYLQSERVTSLRERVANLRTLYERAEDPLVREHLRQADLSLQSAMRDQEEMQVLLERMTAQATHANAALHHVLSQLVKHRLASPDGAWGDYRVATEQLKSLRYQIDAVEQVIAVDPLDHDR